LWALFGIILTCVLTSEATEKDHPAWRLLRNNTFLFVWLPFWYRFCQGFVHFLLSLAILPGPVIYHEGPLLKYYPKWVLDTIQESHALRQKNRPRLAAAGGITLQLTAPDGCVIDALYFRGAGAAVDGPTVIRFNGNAEAIELQDELLPRIYTTSGVNFLMFNYRGVGRSKFLAVWKSELLGHLLGLNRTPTKAGLVLDAWTVTEFALKELGVPCSKLVLVGHSIGGAVSAEMAAAHPHLRVSVCNSRSFSKLSSVVVLLAPSFLGIPAASRKGRALRVLARVSMAVSGWEFDTAKNWSHVQGFKWVEFSRADHIIPHEISLHAVLVEGERAQGRGEEDMRARVLPLINLTGMDNHNRMWLDTEMVQHLDLVAEAAAIDGSGSSVEPARRLREKRLYELLDKACQGQGY